MYDEWNQEDGHVQSETTYDTLINEYVDIETEKEKLEVDLEHKKKLLAVFTDGAQSDDMSNKDEIEQSLEELSQKLGDMYSSVSTTVDEYNQYIGAYNVSTLSSISTSEKINVKMYIVLAIIIFFFFIFRLIFSLTSWLLSRSFTECSTHKFSYIINLL